MAQPLLTDVENNDYETKLEDARRNRNWQDSEPIRKAWLVKQVQRAQARPDEYINGLLVLVGSRGTQYLDFLGAFSKNDEPDVVAAVKANDTPEARRNLYTILRALTEIPKTWAKSALIRFLRGTGKQKGSKYHGAGTFGTDYGWKGNEVENICEVIAGGEGYAAANYCSVLMNYRDLYDDISQAANNDYEEIDIDARNYATNVDRDIEFLKECCDILEVRGLGPVPKPTPKKAKKPRKVKEFKSGDIIRKGTLRDLPLPAHVQVPIQRYDEENKQWLDGHVMEQVVIALGNHGYYQCALVDPQTGRAYPMNAYSSSEPKDDLVGATYLGAWTKPIAKKKILKPKFQWRAVARARRYG